MKADTKLSIQEILYYLHISYLWNRRSDTFIANLSWGLLNHEADFVIINKTGYLTEVEIKRSFADFKADFQKEVFHRDERVYKFYYCVPLSIVGKVKEYMLTQREKLSEFYGTFRMPAILTYDDNGIIDVDKDCCYAYTGFGRKLFLEEQVTIARLLSLRYWSAFDKKVVEEINVKKNGVQGILPLESTE